MCVGGLETCHNLFSVFLLRVKILWLLVAPGSKIADFFLTVYITTVYGVLLINGALVQKANWLLRLHQPL